MKRAGFLRGVVLAGGLAVAAGVFSTAFLPVLGVVLAAQSLVAALSLAYLIYLLSIIGISVGRPTTIALWAVVSITAWFCAPSFLLYLAVHVTMLWLVRSFYFHRGVLAAFCDGALCLGATVAALGALQRTGSPLVAVWTFFLCQAAFVAIPQWRRALPGRAASPNDGFAAANRRAEAALNQLITR